VCPGDVGKTDRKVDLQGLQSKGDGRMELDLKGLEDRVKKVEAEVVGLRETIRKSVSEEIDLDDLASSIAKHSITEEDSTDILIRMRRVGEDWW